MKGSCLSKHLRMRMRMRMLSPPSPTFFLAFDFFEKMRTLFFFTSMRRALEGIEG